MNKLIIVDDEVFALEQLSTLLDWNLIGFELVGTFQNGLEAIEYIKSNEVHTVLTDIKMPHVDGLELTKMCYEQFPSICVVIISAYRDFEYARTAMQYNALDYVTKPINYKDFYNTMLKIATRDSGDNLPESFIDHETQSLCQQIFSNLLCGMYEDIEALEAQLLESDMVVDLSDSPCVIINIHINNFENYMNNIWKHGKFKLYNAISLMLPVKSKNAYYSQVRYASNNIEVISISKPSAPDFNKDVSDFISELRQNLLDLLNLEADIRIVDEFPSLTAVFEAKTIETPITEKTNQGNIIDIAIEYINTHYGDSLTLETVAKYVNISPIYFSTYFKQHSGTNFLTFLTNLRMQKARELLHDKNIKISLVCNMVGYKNSTHFYNVFKAYNNNLTPAQYRDDNVLK